MIKLIEAKSLGDSKFEILVSQDGMKKRFVIVQNKVFIEEMNEFMYYFTAEDRGFSDVWGQSFDFRQEVSKKIKQLKEAEIPELQLA